MALYDAGDARLKIIPDASRFRSDLEAQLKAQQLDFVLRVGADAQKARETVDALRQEQERRPVDLRVKAEARQAEQRIDELRAEQEARPIDLRVNVDESAYSRLSRAVDSARSQVVNANEAVIASERRVDASRRQSATAADAVIASDRRIENVRLQLEGNAEKVAAAEQRLSQVRQNQASAVNPLLTAAENALERARSKGNPADIARSERNLSEMRKALGPQSEEVTRAENALGEARRRGQILENSLAQAVDGGAAARRRAVQAENSLEQAVDNSSAARRRAEQSSRNMARTVEEENRRVRDLSRELNTLGKDFEKAVPVSGFADAFSSLAPIISLLPALATGLAEAAGAAEQLGGAVLSWPGMFASLGSSFGVLLTGIHGMTDAYKALSTSSKDAGNDQVTQARQTREANDQLTSATRAQGEAEHERARAVRDSRQEMQDLNLQLRGGQLDTASAILEAQKARRDLATGQFKDGLDYQEAQLRVQQADLRVSESISNQNGLKNRAADINGRVVGANDRVAQATENVAKAEEHLADVAGKASASQRALDSAMSQLAPNAQEFVKTIYELVHSGPLKDLENTTQQNLFSGMSASIKTLVASDLPTLKTGFGSIATTMNADFKQLFSSLGSDHSKGILSAILGDTSHAQELLKTAIDPLVSAFGTLARAGSDTIPRMADGIGRAADRFSKFIDSADKDGRLDAWINAGITGFTHLGNIFINLGQSLNGITKALGGQGFLATLDDATKKLDTFLNSTKGQDDLRRIFAEGREELRQIVPILKDLPGIFHSAFGAATEGMGVWLPILKTATGFLHDWPGLTQGILEGFLAWKALGPVFQLVRDGLGLAVTGLGSVQTQITNSRVLADSEMSRTAGIFKKVAGEEGVGKLTGALNSLSGLAGPVGFAAVVAAVPLIETAFDKLNQKTKEAAQEADRLNQQEQTLEGTLDRVTGKITAQTRQQAVTNAQKYDATGSAGGGVPGLSKGDALKAATQVGIAPDVYASASLGDQHAMQQVTSVLLQNNLAPELANNKALQDKIHGIEQMSAKLGFSLSDDDVLKAMIGDPDALKKFNDATRGVGMSGRTLTDLDQMLSPTGKASVMAGGQMYPAAGAVGPATSSQQQARQGVYGQARLSARGAQDLGLPPNTQVDPSDTGFSVSVPSIPPQLADKLKQQNIDPKKNLDGSWTFELPLGSKDVEKYDQGGPTPRAAGPLPDGGYHAVMHPDEYVANKTGRQTLGDAFLGAANKGDVDLSLLPAFAGGGAGNIAPLPLRPVPMPMPDPGTGGSPMGSTGSALSTFGREGVPGATGAVPGMQRTLAPAPQSSPVSPGLGQIASNILQGIGNYTGLALGSPGFDQGGAGDDIGPTGQSPDQGTGLQSAFGSAVQGAQGTLNTGLNLMNQLVGMGQQQMAGRDAAPTGVRPAGMAGLPGFYDGGPGDDAVTDQYGNPVGAGGRPPGPGVDAGAGTPGGPVASAAMGGLPGASPFLGMKGLAGLLGAGMVQDPAMQAQALQAWGSQTAQYVAGWAGNTLGSLGSTLWSGLLGGLGLGQSVLSPSNAYTQAGTQGITGALGAFGLGGDGRGGSGSLGGGSLGSLFTNLAARGSGQANPTADALMKGSLDPSILGAGAAGAAGGPNVVTGGARAPSGDIIAPNAGSRATSVPLAPNVESGIRSIGGLPTMYATSGPDAYKVPAGIQQLAKDFGLTASTYASGGSLHQMGYAFDFNAPKNDPAKLQAFAEFVQRNLSGQTLQLIYQNAQSGQKFGIASGQPVGPGTNQPGYYAGDFGGHTDHVHWATDVAPFINPQNMPGATGGSPWNSGSTMNTDARGAVIGAPGAAPSGFTAPAGGPQGAVYQAMVQAGFGPDQWNALNNIITRESAWNPINTNKSSGAYGLFQFLGHQNDKYGQMGGYSSDPAAQAQAGLAYIQDRYGSPAAAWAHWQQNGNYDTGVGAGPLPAGLTLVNNQTGNNEHAAVFNQQQWAGLSQALTTAGSSNVNAKTPPPGPQLQAPPDVQQMQPRTTPSQPVPQQPGPSQQPGATVSPSLPGADAGSPQPGGIRPGQGAPQIPPTSGAAPGQLTPVAPSAPAQDTSGQGPLAGGTYWGPAPESGSHVLPALSTGIKSTANTLGQAAATAMQIGASILGAAGGAGAGPSFGGSLGASAGAAALGGLSGYVQGLFNEGGKIAVDLVNLPSSLMVGNLTPGTSPDASGTSYHPQQTQPATAQVNSNTYNVSGNYELDAAMTALKLKQNQDQQAQLANYRAYP